MCGEISSSVPNPPVLKRKRIMKTFVYVADKANPANFEGVKVGWVEDSGDGTLELLVEIGGHKITTLCTVTIEQSGNGGHFCTALQII